MRHEAAFFQRTLVWVKGKQKSFAKWPSGKERRKYFEIQWWEYLGYWGFQDSQFIRIFILSFTFWQLSTKQTKGRALNYGYSNGTTLMHKFNWGLTQWKKRFYTIYIFLILLSCICNKIICYTHPEAAESQYKQSRWKSFSWKSFKCILCLILVVLPQSPNPLLFLPLKFSQTYRLRITSCHHFFLWQSPLTVDIISSAVSVILF